MYRYYFQLRVVTISLPCYYYFAPVLLLFRSRVITISLPCSYYFHSRVITISLPCSYYFCSLVSTISAPVLLLFPLLCTSLYYFRFTFVAISTACYYYFPLLLLLGFLALYIIVLFFLTTSCSHVLFVFQTNSLCLCLFPCKKKQCSKNLLLHG